VVGLGLENGMCNSDRFETYRAGLIASGSRGDYLEKLLSEPMDLRIALLPVLMELASGTHRYIAEVRAVIASIPETVLNGQLEALAAPHLQRYGQEAVERYLELYEQAAPDLARRLALSASQDSNPEIRSVGKQYLELIDTK